jgi:hypothetical protein
VLDNTTTPHVPAKAGQNKITTDPARPTDGDQRMRELEMKLDKLLKEVEALRREVRRQQPGGAGGGANRSDPTATQQKQ